MRTSVRPLVALAIDRAPAWLWNPANLRFVGSHTIHFCYGHGGRRTVEWDSRELAAGERVWPMQEPLHGDSADPM